MAVKRRDRERGWEASLDNEKRGGGKGSRA